MKTTAKFGFAVLLILVLFSGCKNIEGNGPVSKNEKNMNNKLKVMTYNIHAGRGMDDKVDIKRIADVINKQLPDIVAVQEVDKDTKRSGNIDEPEELAKLTGMNMMFAPAIDYDGGKYGNLILTKLKIVKSDIFPLPGDEKRSLAVTTLESNGKKILFLATHFDNVSQEARINSAGTVNTLVAVGEDLPVILAGDLNSQPDSKTIEVLLKDWTNATEKESIETFSTKDPNEQIDYVLYRPKNKWTVLNTEVINETMASDHFPLLVTLNLND